MLGNNVSDKKDLSALILLFAIPLGIYFFVFQNHSLFKNYATYQNYANYLIILLILTVLLYIVFMFSLFQYVKNHIDNFSTKEKSIVYGIINIGSFALYSYFNNIFGYYSNIYNNIYLPQGPYQYNQNLMILFYSLKLSTLMILGTTLIAITMFAVYHLLGKYFPNDPFTKKYQKFYERFSIKRYFHEYLSMVSYPGKAYSRNELNFPDYETAKNTNSDTKIFINKHNNASGSIVNNQCPKCGSELVKNDNFCENCGHYIDVKTD